MTSMFLADMTGPEKVWVIAFTDSRSFPQPASSNRKEAMQKKKESGEE